MPVTTPPVPAAGQSWSEVVDADLTSEAYRGFMHGVTAGGPGAIAWGGRHLRRGAAGSMVPAGPEIWTTSDGRDWIPAFVERPANADPAAAAEVLDVAPIGTGYVAIGSSFEAGGGIVPHVWTSDEGTAWSLVAEQPSLDRVRLGQLVGRGGEVLAFGCHLASATDCGREGVWASKDGRTWIEEPLRLPGRAESVGIVADGQDRLWGTGYVLSGLPAPYAPSPPERLSSADGRTWTAESLPVLGIERFHPTPGVAFLTVAEMPSDPGAEAPAAWVSRTPGVYRSADLETWQDPAAGTAGATEVASVADTWVMIGTSGAACWSPGSCGAAAWRSVDAGRTWASAPVDAAADDGMPGAAMHSMATLPGGTLVAVGERSGRDGWTRPAAWVSTPEPGTAATRTPAASGGGCTSLSNDFTPGARGSKGDPASLARRLLAGLRASDALVRVDESATSATVRVVRDGAEIGRLHFVSDGSGAWLLDQAVLCEGLRTT